ncbi:glycerol dehydrogenase [Eubacteriaceae bacterium ES3]|nr:glycerol dehydrogenase [Eubacteriaceae bacterium ES3]
MQKIIMSPSRYVQGAGEVEKLPEHVSKLGSSALVLMSGTMMRTKSEELKAAFEAAGIKFTAEKFGGECSKVEVGRLQEIVKTNGCDVIVGVGGGKTLDTAKATAHYEKLPVVIVPSIASTDAPCSALSVLYTEDGIFDEYLVLPKNPEIVIMDTDIIKEAPARLFVAGMGDALATYFEALATVASNGTTMSGAHPTKSALALAKLCYDILIEDGLKAKLAVEAKACTPAVENVIEANTYLSGVGFESGGLAACHAIHNGLTVLSECHHMYHGEKVAFGTLVQLVMENRSIEEIEEVIDFCLSVGLPITLAELGCTEPTPEKIMEVAKAAADPGETIHNMPFDVDADVVYAAIMAADALGQLYLEI